MEVSDTPPEIAALQLEAQRRLAPVDRLRIALEMSELVRELAMTRIRGDHPDWSDTVVRRHFLATFFPEAKLARE